MWPFSRKDAQKADPRDLTSLPGLVPPTDAVLTYLLEEAVLGHVPVYFAAVPLALVWPYAPDFDIEAHPLGKQGVDALYEAGRRGEHHKMWVYPRGDHFVCSDDYATLAAARRGNPDYIPCWVIGYPHLPGVVDVQGPIAPDGVRELLGVSVVRVKGNADG